MHNRPSNGVMKRSASPARRRAGQFASPKERTAYLVAGAGVILFLLAGCGTVSSSSSEPDGSSGGDVPAEVTALAEQAGEPQPWTGPTTSPAMAEDKLIVSIPCSMAAGGCARGDAGIKAAAKAVGWDVLTIDPAFDPNKMNAAIQQAISLGADAIALNAIDPALVKNAVADARRAGIVVVNAAAGHEDDPVTDTSIQHDVSLNGALSGNMAAAVLCVDRKGEGNVMILTDPAFSIITQRVDGFQDYVKKCPRIQTQVQQISANDIGNVLQSKIKALLGANPDVDTIQVPSDAFTPDVIAALQQVGLADKVKVYSIDGNPQVIADIQAGGPTVADIGAALGQLGWATVDNINRLIQGEPTVDDGIPSRVVTKEFIPAGGQYDGDVDYVAKYEELWSTGKTTN